MGSFGFSALLVGRLGRRTAPRAQQVVGQRQAAPRRDGQDLVDAVGVEGGERLRALLAPLFILGPILLSEYAQSERGWYEREARQHRQAAQAHLHALALHRKDGVLRHLRAGARGRGHRDARQARLRERAPFADHLEIIERVAGVR